MIDPALLSKYQAYLEGIPSSPSRSTRDAYSRALNVLSGSREYRKNFDFLKDTEYVMDFLSERAVPTRSLYLSAIVHAIRMSKKLGAKLLNQYQDAMKETSTILHARPEGSMTKTQAENWMDWEDILKHRSVLEEKADAVYRQVEAGKPLTPARLDTIQQFVIVALMTYMRPRRCLDYHLLRLTDKSMAEVSEEEDTNWLSLKDHQAQYSNYKTARKVEEKTGSRKQEVEVPEELVNILKKYENILPDKSGYVFQKTDGTLPRSNNVITRLLNRAFHPKKISANMLRHSYLTHKHAPTEEDKKKLNERIEDAEAMGHSLSQQKEYILDKDAPIVDTKNMDIKMEPPVRKPRVRRVSVKGGSKRNPRIQGEVGELEATLLMDDTDPKAMKRRMDGLEELTPAEEHDDLSRLFLMVG